MLNTCSGQQSSYIVFIPRSYFRISLTIARQFLTSISISVRIISGSNCRTAAYPSSPIRDRLHTICAPIVSIFSVKSANASLIIVDNQYLYHILLPPIPWLFATFASTQVQVGETLFPQLAEMIDRQKICQPLAV